MNKNIKTLILLIVLCFSSWIITCGIIKIITICFSLNFKWNIATGIWIIFILINFSIGKIGSKN